MTGRAVPVFRGVATDKGTVDLEQPVQFRSYVRRLAGKHVEVIVRKQKTLRSLKSNAYYWVAVIGTIAFELGYTKDEAHEALAWQFLREGEADAKLPRRKSTADLTMDEFSEYISTVKRFAATDLGIYVPEPNEIDL